MILGCKQFCTALHFNHYLILEWPMLTDQMCPQPYCLSFWALVQYDC